jgi:hypothetical protein
MRHHHSGHTPRRHPALAYIAAITIALAASGCHVSTPQEPATPSGAADTLNTLKSLPSLEETQTQLQAAMDQTTTAASAIAPGVTWTTDTNAASSECAPPYDQSPGRSRYLPNRIAANAVISEQQWSDIQRAAQQAAASLQATESQIMQNSPGNHDIGFYGPAGLFLKISYRGNLVVAGYTGCRLPDGQTYTAP